MNIIRCMYVTAAFVLTLLNQTSAFGLSLESQAEKARHWLVNDMRQKVDSYFKDIPYYLNVDLIYDANKLENSLIKIPSVGDKPLPGLSQMNSTVLREFEIKNLQNIDILQKVDSVVVKISINRAFSESTRAKVETFFRNSLNDYGFSNVDISIISAKIDFETKPLAPEALLPFAERNPVLSGLAAMALLMICFTGFVFMMIRASRSHATKLSTSLKDSANAGPAFTDITPMVEPLKQIPAQDAGASGHSRREPLDSKLKIQLANNPKLSQLISSYLFQSRHHAMAFVLLGLLKEEHRSQVLNASSKEQHEEYLAYLREDGYRLASDEEKMIEYINSIYKMVLMGQQDPESLFGFFIRDSIDKLTAPEIKLFMAELSPERAWDLLQVLGSERTADLISAGVLEASSVGTWLDSDATAKPDLRAVFEELSIFSARSQQGSQDRRTVFMSDVGNMLPLRAEEALYEGSSQPTQAKLSRLTEVEIQKTISFVNRLGIAEASELLFTLDEALTNRILKELPEIKSNRIQSQKSALTKRGRLLKQNLVASLQSTDSSDELLPNVELPLERSA